MSPLLDRAEATNERRLVGLGISSGVAIGSACLLTQESFTPPRRSLSPEEVPTERARFATAVEAAIQELDVASTRTGDLPPAAREEIQLLLEAHKAMLQGSRLIRGVEGRITRSRINAEAALEAEIENIAKSFAAIPDSYLSARIDDVRGLGTRLLSLLLNRPVRSLSDVPKGAILLSDDLTPADTAQIDTKLIKGIATVTGGAQGHSAIMARTLGIPAVMGLSGLLNHVQDGMTVIIDGRQGLVILDPSPDTLATYDEILIKIQEKKKQLRRMRGLKSVTQDGTLIRLMANLEMPADVPAAISAGAEGVGLLRTEFMFMRRADLPDEDEQYEHLKSVILAMDGRPVTIRTLDIGGDKLAAALSHFHAPEANPALGLRAIRLSLHQPDLLETQFAAILRAAAFGPVRIMLPLVTQVGEVERARRLLEIVARRLRRRKIEIPETLPELGVMIEVPAAALIADDLAQVADFFSIGTNDLTQYTLAVDRANEHVAALFDPLHPGVLKLIQMATTAADTHNIPISVCGEMAGDARVTGILLKIGIRELSMSPPMLPMIKHEIRGITLKPSI